MAFAKQPKAAPPIFPTHKTEWWEEDSSPPLQESKDNATTNVRTIANTDNNYGSTEQSGHDEEEPSFLLDNIVDVSFPSPRGSNGTARHDDEFGEIKDVPSDISNNSSSDEEDGSSGYFDDEDDLEPPHRTCG